MIPEFDADGDLPPGIHLATLTEVERRYGRFNASDRRVKLFARLAQIFNLARASGIAERLVIGGSFVTGKAEPNDVDLVIMLAAEIDFDALTPSQYVVASRQAMRRVVRGHDYDVLMVRAGTSSVEPTLEFFQSTRSDKRVGLVEVKL